MKLSLILVFLIIGLNYTFAQFNSEFKVGIENPYLYEYNLNYSPTSSAGFRVQEFKFLRSKFYSAGFSYDLNLGKRERIILNGGLLLGLMDQFIADTIIHPIEPRLIYNVKHRSVYLEPRISIGYMLTRSFYVLVGLDGFVPINKVLKTSNESIVFKRIYERDFYPAEIYARIGIYYKIKKITIGIELEDTGGTRSKLWVRSPSFLYGHSGPSHNAQRWMILIKYSIVRSS